MKEITKIQIKLIKVAVKELKLSDEQYRDILSVRYSVNTCKKLTYTKAYDLIEHFKGLGFKIRKKKRERNSLPPNVLQLPSKQILLTIDHMKEDIKWQFPDGYYRWIKRRFHIEKIKTMKEAIMVFEGLKNMKCRGKDAKTRIS